MQSRSPSLRVAVFFGGRSPEHEISLLSARNITRLLMELGHLVVPIGIDPSGVFKLYPTVESAIQGESDPKKIHLGESGDRVTLLPFSDGRGVFVLSSVPHHLPIDVAFPIVHGMQGEDGMLQGLFELAQIPYVGAGLHGMAVTLDKVTMKRLLIAAGISTPRFLTFSRAEWAHSPRAFRDLRNELGPSLFIKPVNTGSSIGISKVTADRELNPAIKEAFQYDTHIIVEEGLSVRELEVSILGNQEVEASIVGEILPTHEFYSYEAKYVDPNGATFRVPADLPASVSEEVRTLAIRAAKLAKVYGMARVDFFMDKGTGKIYLNEINPLPGFTNISMYPKLWEATGLPPQTVLSKLLDLARERFAFGRTLSANYAALR